MLTRSATHVALRTALAVAIAPHVGYAAIVASQSDGADQGVVHTAIGRAEQRPTPPDDPLHKLAGDWGLTVFVMGAGQFGGPKCGKGSGPGGAPVKVAASNEGAVSFAAACDNKSEYSFRLGHDSATQAYVLSVTSTPGISVQDFPVAYVEGKGWQGKRDEAVDNETQSITAMIAPIEGRRWYGWMIAVLPTAGVGHEDDLKQPFFRADLTRAK